MTVQTYKNKYYIGIDPGTSCGWSVLDQDGNLYSCGYWDLSPDRHEGGGMRYLRLRKKLNDLIESLDCVEALSYEQVSRHKGTAASHIYGGIIAIITELCESKKIPYKGIAVGTIKKLATGKGNSSKTLVTKAANKKWDLDLNISDKPSNSDNDISDALWIAECLRQELLL